MTIKPGNVRKVLCTSAGQHIVNGLIVPTVPETQRRAQTATKASANVGVGRTGSTGHKFLIAASARVPSGLTRFFSLSHPQPEMRARGRWSSGCGQRQELSPAARTKLSGPRFWSKCGLNLCPVLGGNDSQSRSLLCPSWSQSQPPGSLIVTHLPAMFLHAPRRSLGSPHCLAFLGPHPGCSDPLGPGTPCSLWAQGSDRSHSGKQGSELPGPPSAVPSNLYNPSKPPLPPSSPHHTHKTERFSPAPRRVFDSQFSAVTFV